MDANKDEVLGVMMTTTRDNQEAIAKLLEGLKNEIEKVNAAAVAAQEAANKAEQAAAVLHNAAEAVAAAAAKGAHEAVGPAVTTAFEGASEASAIALGLAAKPTLDKFAGISDAAAEAEERIRNAAMWFSWKLGLIALAGVAGVCLVAWGFVAWQRSEYLDLVTKASVLSEKLGRQADDLDAKQQAIGKFSSRRR